MEFVTRTFIKSKHQTSYNGFWLYFLIGVIFLLIAYLLYEFGLTGWPIWITTIAGMGMMYWSRYYSAFRKENFEGEYVKEISMNEIGVRISELFLPYEKIDSIEIKIDKYEGQVKAKYRTFIQSDGTSNTITITTNEMSYSEFFHLRDKKHYQNLILVVRKLKKNGINILLS